jgi:hypothetical protein
MVDQQSSVQRLAKGVELVYGLEQPRDVFAPDAVFDINIPSWRFQLGSPEAFVGWFRHYTKEGYKINVENVVETQTGFAMELEGEYTDHHGDELYFRNLLLCKVAEGLITEVIYYCTGDWDRPTRERQAKEAALVRR